MSNNTSHHKIWDKTDKFHDIDHKTEFNILIINYSDNPWKEKAIVEPIASLLNEKTGILYNAKVREQLGISENIAKISAFIVYQCTSDAFISSDFTCNLPFMQMILNPLCQKLDPTMLLKHLQINQSNILLPITFGLPQTDMKKTLYNFMGNRKLNHGELATLCSLFADLQKI